MCELLTKCAHT